ncbi:MAG: arsenate reductase ArsC [Candidatus Zixiibacteriota bacterium]
MRILILCTGNSCRSQMAEGFVRHFLKGNGEVASAGLEPKGVHPLAIRVMGEIGIDISHHNSRHLSEYTGRQFDYVITVCDNAAERCPVFSGNAQRLHWPFEDPAAIKGSEWEILEAFRRIRDQIGEKVKAWCNENQEL